MTLAALRWMVSVALCLAAISARAKEVLPPEMLRPSEGVKVMTGDLRREALRLRTVTSSSISCPASMGLAISLREMSTIGAGAGSLGSSS